jgi:Kelch motif
VGLNDKLYVIGGFVEGWTPTDDVHEYDPASDRWQRLAALPTPRGAACSPLRLAPKGLPEAPIGIGGRGTSSCGGVGVTTLRYCSGF